MMTFKRYWKCWVLLLVLQEYGAEAVCNRTQNGEYTGTYSIQCDSIDQTELISFQKQSGIKYWREIKIDNSRFQYLNKLIPNMIPKEEPVSLTMTNCQIMKINPYCLEQHGYFRDLDLSRNYIRDLDFLKNLQHVRKINLSHNRIEHINGTYFKDIYPTEIDLSFNNIKSVHNIENIRLLSVFNLSHNSINKLDNFFGPYNYGLVSLTIDLSFNDLVKISSTDLNPYSHSYMDLDVSHNQVSFLDSSLKANSLIARNNFITSFNFTNFEGNGIDLSNNQINELNIDRKKPYVYLNIENNKIRKLIKKEVEVTKFINLAHNGISDISNLTFAHYSCKNQRSISVSLNNNELKQVNLSKFDDLKDILVLNLSHNPLEHIFRNSINEIKIETLDLSHCLLKTLDGNIFKNISLTRLNLGYNSLEKLPQDIFKDLCLLELNLAFNPLGEFKITNELCIEKLSLYGIILRRGESSSIIRTLDTKQSDVYFSNQTNISNSSLPSQPANSSLNYITLSSFSLMENSDKNVSDLISELNFYMTELIVTIDDKIGKNSFNKLINLEKLRIIHSSISDITNGSFSGLSHLRELTFHNSNISNVEPGAFLGLDRLEILHIDPLFHSVKVVKSYLFDGLTKLKFLNLSMKGIETIEANAFRGLDSLENLNLSSNAENFHLDQDALRGLANLKMLDLSNNSMVALLPDVFVDMANLQELYLRNNSFAEIYIELFSKLESLTVLDLSHSYFRYPHELPLFPLKNLLYLNLNDNKQYLGDGKTSKKFSLKYIPNLKYIGIGKNDWSCDYLLDVLKELRSKQVNYLEMSDLYYEGTNIEGIACIEW